VRVTNEAGRIPSSANNRPPDNPTLCL
jgi:hypothetical protein